MATHRARPTPTVCTSSMHRASFRRILLAAGVLVALLSVSSCGHALLSGVYFLEATRATYFTERFDWLDEGRWHYDSEEAFAPNAFQIQGGRFIAYDWRQYAVTHETYPGELEIWLDWEVWYPDDSLAPADKSNGDVFDIRIVLDTSGTDGAGVTEGANPSGPSVELTFYDTTSTPVDRLTVREDATGAGSVAAAEVASTGLQKGSLRARFRLGSESPRITATVVDGSTGLAAPLLETALDVTSPWPDEFHVMVEASGHLSASVPAPRVLDTVHVMPLLEAP